MPRKIRPQQNVLCIACTLNLEKREYSWLLFAEESNKTELDTGRKK